MNRTLTFGTAGLVADDDTVGLPGAVGRDRDHTQGDSRQDCTGEPERDRSVVQTGDRSRDDTHR